MIASAGERPVEPGSYQAGTSLGALVWAYTILSSDFRRFASSAAHFRASRECSEPSVPTTMVCSSPRRRSSSSSGTVPPLDVRGRPANGKGDQEDDRPRSHWRGGREAHGFWEMGMGVAGATVLRTPTAMAVGIRHGVLTSIRNITAASSVAFSPPIGCHPGTQGLGPKVPQSVRCGATRGLSEPVNCGCRDAKRPSGRLALPARALLAHPLVGTSRVGSEGCPRPPQTGPSTRDLALTS